MLLSLVHPLLWGSTLLFTSGAAASQALSRCSTNGINLPSTPGLIVSSTSIQPVIDYSILGQTANPEVEQNVTISFCNITINYGHQGWKDDVQVTIWLPLDNWNERLSGIGGAGFSSLYTFNRFAPAISRGYAAVGTDAGHDHNPLNTSTWALDAQGNVNFYLLQNFFAISQAEAAIMAKQVISAFYGREPKFSYWDGCSTGGRQGFMLAQRYPDLYDGILAGAPAFNWANFVPGTYYPQFVMNQLKHYPAPCVLEYINTQAKKACDSLDGVTDGIVSSPDSCTFDPYSVVGHTGTCNGQHFSITTQDAEIVQKVWHGTTGTNGTFLWYGMNKGTTFSNVGNTTCTATECQGVPFGVASEWLGRFVLQDPEFDLTSLSESGFEGVFKQSVAAYKSVASTDDPNLSGFREAGGKLIHWHGLADQQIYPKGSEDYYKRAEALDHDLRHFYRFFEAPGVGHCGHGYDSHAYGLQPADPFSVLVNWVEKGIAPDVLPASTPDAIYSRNLCPYPQVPVYHGGDPKKAESFNCK
ncbi:feruloyl esterase B precursor [Penicillium hordei]|uniref:Carboxylic ester hydrolase n=1 Tax=Penicillium hordei TaxID=40994 RepID=A0AAD6E6V9_9EURO|nr:feruloyl esterase B precursor [Penicillium hordei]KAJ5602467.1 feruloyl esterase B precursor [Penicillium hordei]